MWVVLRRTCCRTFSRTTAAVSSASTSSPAAAAAPPELDKDSSMSNRRSRAAVSSCRSASCRPANTIFQQGLFDGQVGGSAPERLHQHRRLGGGSKVGTPWLALTLHLRLSRKQRRASPRGSPAVATAARLAGLMPRAPAAASTSPARSPQALSVEEGAARARWISSFGRRREIMPSKQCE